MGHGIAKDDHKAVELYQKAADKGHANALYNLGLYHYYGEGGLAKDLKQAESLFKRAADLGHEKAASAAASVAEELKASNSAAGQSFSEIQL
jgi:TPR repeat protein